jgi:hypothetical protein
MHAAFLFLPDSGYLFSGSRPPSRVSRPKEVPLSGKEDKSREGGTRKLLEVGEAQSFQSRVLKH